MKPHTEVLRQLDETLEELGQLEGYPLEKLAGIIRDVGFECDRCTRCCTRAFNDHVFLLEEDAERVRTLDPECIAPAPYFDFCDRDGRFYVEGYALRYRADGTCTFLANGLCGIYEQRPSICRIYPYMLHRETDGEGNLDWRQVSGLNEHGYYHAEMTLEESLKTARQVMDYESGFLRQREAFLRAVLRHFNEKGLRHVRRQYDLRMRDYADGKGVPVFVYHKGELHLQTTGKA